MSNLGGEAKNDRGLIAIVVVVLISALPALLQFLGAGMDTGVVDYKEQIFDAITGVPLEETDYGLIQGTTLYSLLEWTVVLLAMATAALAYVHFHVKRRTLSILIGLSAFWVAAITAFHLLAFHGFSTAVENLGDFVQFNWTMSQTFTALLILVTAIVVLWRENRGDGLHEIHVAVAVAAISVVAYAIIFATAQAPSLPSLTDPERIISRPLELVPLALFTLAAVVALPMLDRRCQTPFSIALWLGSIPLVASQLYMAIPSVALFDDGFTAAQLAKTFAFLVVFVGLATDYARACRRETMLSRQLSVSDRRIRMFFDNAVEAIITFDEERRVRSWNRRAERLFGPINGRWQQRDVLEVLFGSRRERRDLRRAEFQQVLDECRDHGDEQKDSRRLREVVVDDPKGVPRTIEYSIVAAPGDDETLFAVMARDVSEQRHLQQQMTRMDRLVSMGTLAAGIVHELRNPLTFVLTNVQIAVESVDELRSTVRVAAKCPDGDSGPSPAICTDIEEVTDDVAEALRAANEGVNRIHRIIDDMRSFARTRRERLEAVDIEQPLRMALRMTKGQLQRTARVETQLNDIASVDADETRLSQVFVNLITNAAHAMEESDVDDHVLRIEATRSDGQVVIRFHDTGPGMSQKVQSQIFHPFYTTKSPDNGTGLGLALSKSIIEDFGGKIDVESAPGQGTTFEIRLPISD